MLNRILAILFLLGGIYVVHTVLVNSAVKDAETQLHQVYGQKLTEAKDSARTTERKITKDFNEITIEKDKKLRSSNDKLTAALNELRNRPKRPSGSDNSSSTTVGKTCTGAELYGEDAEFLTREASRAESVLIERDSYYDRYEQARRRLDEIATGSHEETHVTERD